jgi:hypothetical protein
MKSTSMLCLDGQRADYRVENVRWTQYFSAEGKALLLTLVGVVLLDIVVVVRLAL